MTGIDRQVRDVATSWDREYERDRYRGEAPVGFVTDILETVEAEDLSNSRGLYVGCGNGRNYVPLVEAGLDLMGLDTSPAAISQLGRRLPERHSKLVVGTVEDLAADVTFPIVIGIQVFQHGTRDQAHHHLQAAQARTAPGGFCLRVNSAGTDVWPAHDRFEDAQDGSFSVRYTTGSKAGLDIHFYSDDELQTLFADNFEEVLSPRVATELRDVPEHGRWRQWEAIWRRRST